MGELYTGQWQENGATHEIAVGSPEPLSSAAFFKHVSDVIWHGTEPTFFGEPTARSPVAMPIESAAELMTAAVGDVDPKLALTAGQTPLRLRGTANVHGFIPASHLTRPNAAVIETTNMDTSLRFIRDKDDQFREVQFTDGHLDYSRKLAVSFRYDFSPEEILVVSYVMNRHEQSQDERICLFARAWFSPLATRGYDDGEAVAARELTEQQETRVLYTMAAIGRLSVLGPSSF